MAHLIVSASFAAEHVGVRFDLRPGHSRFGRAVQCAPIDIELFGDRNMSRMVGHFDLRDDGWWVVDSGSIHGILVNDELVDAVVAPLGRRVHDGDRITVARVVLIFHDDR
jgi:hypothetical protein